MLHIMGGYRYPVTLLRGDSLKILKDTKIRKSKFKTGRRDLHVSY